MSLAVWFTGWVTLVIWWRLVLASETNTSTKNKDNKKVTRENIISQKYKKAFTLNSNEVKPNLQQMPYVLADPQRSWFEQFRSDDVVI